MLDCLRVDRRRCLPLFILGIALTFVPGAMADAPAGYYDTVDETDSATLRASLHLIIDGHTKIPYTEDTTDTWNVLELADEDPLDSGRILDVYRNRSFIKYGAGNNEYNREHTWPKSFGFPDDGSTNFPYSDCHMLFLCDDGYNSSRSNNVFNDCTTVSQSYPTDNYNGQVGVNYRYYELPEGRWEVWEERKGDMARAMFYADVRYEGGAPEPDLILTNDINLIAASNTGSNEAVGYMGILSTLIQWHKDDPVDPREVYRNDVVQLYQGNRNPFVDNPDWALLIFQGYISDVPDVIREGTWIASIHPNPFNPATNIDFAIGQSGLVRIEVFSLQGQRVRVLLDETRPAGTHTIRWDGADSFGGRVASGAYFCRVSNAGGIDTKPLLLLK